ncbi:MAG: T9SS type A sorting domain-containing protein, partial [Bacteroidales bacterium]|nr:T9SS type A sorting domain-containing protein [Bacteroidales bacterium]
NDNYLNDRIKIYPIPSIDKIIIDCSETQNLYYIIYNCLGEIVLQGELAKVSNEIDISSLTSGLLIIRLTGVDWTVQKKIIKK